MAVIPFMVIPFIQGSIIGALLAIFLLAGMIYCLIKTLPKSKWEGKVRVIFYTSGAFQGKYAVQYKREGVWFCHSYHSLLTEAERAAELKYNQFYPKKTCSIFKIVSQ